MMHPALRLGCAAAAFNGGMLLVNMGFTRTRQVASLNPDMFSPFGQVMVLVWGAAFLAAGASKAAPPVWCVFVVEKLAYVLGWLRWLAGHDARAIVAAARATGGAPDVINALFHALFGVGDFLFAALFARHALALYRGKRRD